MNTTNILLKRINMSITIKEFDSTVNRHVISIIDACNNSEKYVLNIYRYILKQKNVIDFTEKGDLKKAFDDIISRKQYDRTFLIDLKNHKFKVANMISDIRHYKLNVIVLIDKIQNMNPVLKLNTQLYIFILRDNIADSYISQLSSFLFNIVPKYTIEQYTDILNSLVEFKYNLIFDVVNEEFYFK